ncbi:MULTISPECIES: hypothetical protein [unclassified Cryobacterium]|uniref:hypothetical protein n=1 Tax=unclassified Cryobacterium TaxID=2649013 RepID=UPI002AB41134|nr:MULTISPECIES: hypothetical protein [unclassified Cryobacterium]MDY7542617.1 hypothetical protein [Cryobacterium sp. 5B3]MEB0264737.1 hypothetical protein [Cryobacterium sp. 10I5]MEB0273709.1 hypothetical protein [Cryobacterium sp. 5B3]
MTAVSPGRIVQFTVTEQQAKQINAQRTQAGHATKTGNVAREGDSFPMIVVRVWPNECVNGQAFLDGNDTLWVCSAGPEDQTLPTGGLYGKWRWPERV